MRVDDGGGAATPVPPKPVAHPAATASTAPAAKAVPAKPDRIEESGEKHDGLLGSIGDWAKDEWSTVAGAAHGLTTVPGLVSRAFGEAAEKNEKIAGKIENAAENWTHTAASVRQKNIDALSKAAADVSKAGKNVASDLAKANELPLKVEKAANGIDSWLKGAAKSVRGAVDSAIDSAPAELRAGLRGAANGAESLTAKAYDGVKGAARSAYDGTVNKLPSDVANEARSTAKSLEDVASSQASQAKGAVRATSRLLGTAPSDISKALNGGELGSIAEHVPGFVRETPVLGFVLAGAGTAYDAKHGKSAADSEVANFGSTVAGTAAASGTTSLLAGTGGGAIADGAGAELAGAVVASGPAGWAVAGGVVAGAALGYGVYKAVESKAGQDVIDGITHLDGSQIEKGLGEGATDVEHLGDSIGHKASSAYDWAKHSIASIF